MIIRGNIYRFAEEYQKKAAELVNIVGELKNIESVVSRVYKDDHVREFHDRITSLENCAGFLHKISERIDNLGMTFTGATYDSPKMGPEKIIDQELF